MSASNSQYRNSNLLYRPSFSVWTARIKDKAQSATVNTNNGAVDGAANVHKQLLPDSPQLKAIQQYAGAFRQWIYDNTLPWDDSGWRIGRVSHHMDFMADVGDRMQKFNDLVEDFMAVYDGAREAARFTLNGMFNDGDYPGMNEVRTKFGFTVDVTSLPSTEDFRVVDGLPQEEVDRLVGVATTNANDRMQAAMQEAYQRLHTVVEKMATTLTAYGNKGVKTFHNTLVGNIADVVAVMPALNILNDPKLAALAEDAKALCAFDPEDLRKDDRARKAAIEEAVALAKKFGMAATTNPAKPKPVAPSAVLANGGGHVVSKPVPPLPTRAVPPLPAPAATSIAASLRSLIED